MRSRLILSIGLLALCTGCALRGKPQFTELLWPAPPETARIRFEGVLRSQSDLGRSSGELFMEALLGAKKAPDALDWPMAVAPSKDGKRLYVSDSGLPAVVVFDLQTNRVSILGAAGHGLKSPLGLALDDSGNIYVADTAQKLVRVFAADGQRLRDITHPTLDRPTGVAVDEKRQRIYVANSSGLASNQHAVAVFDWSGALLNTIGERGTEEGKFFFPTYLTVDPAGNLYVADTMNSRVQVFSPEGRHVKTVGQRGDALGMFDKPKGLAMDSFGNLYVVDGGWGSVQIFNQERDLLLFFGGQGRFPGLLYSPTAIAIDKSNRIYVADPFEHRVNIYQLINTGAEDPAVTKSLRAEKGGGSPQQANGVPLKQASRN